MNCRERNYELIVEIRAYSHDAISFEKPMQDGSKYIDSTCFSVDNSKVIILPMKKMTGKLSESVKHDRSGKSYTVTLNWEVDSLNREEYEMLSSVENEFKHLIVKTFGGNDSLIRSNNTGYRFIMEEDAGIIKCSLSVINFAGVQRII